MCKIAVDNIDFEFQLLFYKTTITDAIVCVSRALATDCLECWSGTIAEILLHFCAFVVGPCQSFFPTLINDRRPTGKENLLVAGDRGPTTFKATSFQLMCAL